MIINKNIKLIAISLLVLITLAVIPLNSYASTQSLSSSRINVSSPGDGLTHTYYWWPSAGQTQTGVNIDPGTLSGVSSGQYINVYKWTGSWVYVGKLGTSFLDVSGSSGLRFDFVNASTFSYLHTVIINFSYYSADNNDVTTINNNASTAATNATNAMNAANTAASNATNAYNQALAAETDANYIRNSQLSVSAGIVQDNSGTVLSAARSANTNASTAASQSTTAASKSTQAVNDLENTTYGLSKIKTDTGTAATNSTSALNAVSNANGDTVSAVRDSTGSVLQAARDADTNTQTALNTLNTLQTSVTNINNTISTDTISPSVDVKTLSGATATSGSTIQLVISASDNKSTTFTYGINGGVFAVLPSNGIVTAPVTGSGPNAIQVTVKDQAGNPTSKTITIWKLQ